jgi:BirA family transcriptional regulator, biotin operon repressor / biotin---[acetyl-CoA-carboxylase] ligase
VLDLARIRAALPYRNLHYFPTTTTTMAEAARLAARGAASGTIVLADKQTAGRGRLGRAWYSEAGAGLYFTLILRPGRTAPMTTLAAGLAVHNCLSSLCPDAHCDIRWPNDVLLHERKAAGILVIHDGGTMLIGIGINVNHAQFPVELHSLATSLRLITGVSQSRESLFLDLVQKLETAFQWSPAEVTARFAAASSYADGRHVQVEETGLKGTTCGLDSEGFLLIRRADGTVERVLAGGVRPI